MSVSIRSGSAAQPIWDSMTAISSLQGSAMPRNPATSKTMRLTGRIGLGRWH
jgi:hypothetical protein